jgi:hypothetical protein
LDVTVDALPLAEVEVHTMEDGPEDAVGAAYAWEAAELGRAGIVDKMSNLSQQTVLGYGPVDSVAVVSAGQEVAGEEGAEEVVVVAVAGAAAAVVVVAGVVVEYFEVLLPASGEQLTGIVEVALRLELLEAEVAACTEHMGHTQGIVGSIAAGTTDPLQLDP